MACIISAETAKAALVGLRIQAVECHMRGRSDLAAPLTEAADHIEAALAVHVAGEAVAR